MPIYFKQSLEKVSFFTAPVLVAAAALGPDVVVVAEDVAAALTYPTALMKAQQVGPACALLDAVVALAAVAAGM